jgi:hypothetical protein
MNGEHVTSPGLNYYRDRAAEQERVRGGQAQAVRLDRPATTVKSSAGMESEGRCDG